jgi:hypothetical protein
MKFVVSAHGTNIANYFLRYHTIKSCGSGANLRQGNGRGVAKRVNLLFHDESNSIC